MTDPSKLQCLRYRVRTLVRSRSQWSRQKYIGRVAEGSDKSVVATYRGVENPHGIA